MVRHLFGYNPAVLIQRESIGSRRMGLIVSQCDHSVRDYDRKLCVDRCRDGRDRGRTESWGGGVCAGLNFMPKVNKLPVLLVGSTIKPKVREWWLSGKGEVHGRSTT